LHHPEILNFTDVSQEFAFSFGSILKGTPQEKCNVCFLGCSRVLERWISNLWWSIAVYFSTTI